MRALVDYLKKTPWKLVMSEVVEAEVKARVRREFQDNARKLGQALRNARRHRVLGVPEFELELAVDLSYAAWESHWDRVMEEVEAERIYISVEAARDAATRAAERVPPCNGQGEGMRDALIWAGLLEAAGPLATYDSVAFVSPDGHFNGPDGRSLKEELGRDLQERVARVSYYPSLDDFLKERAMPVAHITKSWILQRLRKTDLANVMEGWVYAKYHERSLFAAGYIWDDLYVSDDIPGLFEDVLEAEIVDQDLDEFYVWQFDNGHLELRMQVRAQINLFVTPLPELLRPNSSMLKSRSSISVQRGERWEVKFGFTARIVGDHLENVGMEDPSLFTISNLP